MKVWGFYTGFKEFTFLIHWKVWDTHIGHSLKEGWYTEYRFHILLWEISLLVSKKENDKNRDS